MGGIDYHNKVLCKHIGRIIIPNCKDYPDKCKDCKHNEYADMAYEQSKYEYLKEHKYHYYEQDRPIG